MSRFRIGVLSDCFGLGVREGVSKAAELGAEGVQIFTVSGEMSPEEMDAAGRAEFKKFCADKGLVISALCGDFGGGFGSPEKNPQSIERTKRIIDLAVDLGTDVVTTHFGVTPEDREDPTYQAMFSACREISDHAAAAGVTFATETGAEPASHLKSFLDDVGGKGLGVNLDPANLVMLDNDDPVQAVHTLKDYIVHTHAKDGMRPLCSEVREVPLGTGQVDWDAYLNALTEIGYSGFLTIEREAGDDRVGDIAKAIAFLREKIG